ncbi:tetratricopeptide repeat protein [Elusimicrobiota bacterium]
MKKVIIGCLAVFALSNSHAFENIKLIEEIKMPGKKGYPSILAADSKNKIVYVASSKKAWHYDIEEKKWNELYVPFKQVLRMRIDGMGNLLALNKQGEIWLKPHKNNKWRLLTKTKQASDFDLDSVGRIWFFNGALNLLTATGQPQYSFGKYPKNSKISINRHSDSIAILGGNTIIVVNERGRKLGGVEAKGIISIALDNYMWLYAGTAKSSIIEMSPKLKTKGNFGRKGKNRGEFNFPCDIAIDNDQNLWVLDAKNRRIQSFEVENKDKIIFSSPSKFSKWSFDKGKKTPFFTDPAVIKQDAQKSGNMFVLVNKGKKAGIYIMNNEGSISQLGTVKNQKGKPVAPSKIISITSDSKGKFLYILSRKEMLILERKTLKLNATVSFKKSAVKNPRDLIYANEKLYVMDLKQIHTYTEQGIYLASYGPNTGKSIAPNTFTKLSKIHYNKEKDRLFVLDSGIPGIWILDSKGKYLSIIAQGKTKEKGALGSFINPTDFMLDPHNNLIVLDQNYIEAFEEVQPNKYTFAHRKGLSKEEISKNQSIAWAKMDKSTEFFFANSNQQSIYKFNINYTPGYTRNWVLKDMKGAVKITMESDDPKMEHFLYRSTPKQPDKYTSLGEIKPGKSFFDKNLEGNTTYYYQMASKSLWSKNMSPMSLVKSFVLTVANQPTFKISNVKINPIYSANYKYFAKNPIGKATIKNTSSKVFQNIKVGFLIKEFMDFPTEKAFSSFAPGQEESIDLRAVFNNKILEISEDTPIQTELTVTYFDKDEQREIKKTTESKIYSRNALIWDDLARLGNFVTPKDPPVVDFVKEGYWAMDKKLGLDGNKTISPELAKLFAIWNILGLSQAKYLPDPTNPYAKSSEIMNQVDYLQYPRETLQRKTGDCDDLVTLLATIGEVIGAETAFADLPGHILIAFNTGIEAGKKTLTDAPIDMYEEINGTLWIPIEATLTDSSLIEAWTEGKRVFTEEKATKKLRVLETKQAWEKGFAPATLPESKAREKADMGKANMDKINVNFSNTKAKLLELWEKHLKAKSENDNNMKEDLAFISIKFEEYSKAQDLLKELLKAQPDNIRAMNNLANIHVLAKNYKDAIALYEKAMEIDPYDWEVRTNLKLLKEVKK